MLDSIQQNRVTRCLALLVAAMTLFGGVRSHGQESHEHRATMIDPAPFVANSGKSFTQLMEDAMSGMDRVMRNAPMNGIPEHDFVTMMIPHHQGAIDMAQALLLSTTEGNSRRHRKAGGEGCH
jgi:uncharacterized protein (DUF305 family)